MKHELLTENHTTSFNAFMENCFAILWGFNHFYVVNELESVTIASTLHLSRAILTNKKVGKKMNKLSLNNKKSF